MLAIDVLVKTLDFATQFIAGATSVKVSLSPTFHMLDESLLGHECRLTGAIVTDHDVVGVWIPR
jgi:hypothetical protein